MRRTRQGTVSRGAVASGGVAEPGFRCEGCVRDAAARTRGEASPPPNTLTYAFEFAALIPISDMDGTNTIAVHSDGLLGLLLDGLVLFRRTFIDARGRLILREIQCADDLLLTLSGR